MFELAQTTQPTWDVGVINILKEFWALIGGTAGIVALLLALKHAGLIGKVQQEAKTAKKKADTAAVASEVQRTKINELAEKNPAEVEPLPPTVTPEDK